VPPCVPLPVPSLGGRTWSSPRVPRCPGPRASSGPRGPWGVGVRDPVSSGGGGPGEGPRVPFGGRGDPVGPPWPGPRPRAHPSRRVGRRGGGGAPRGRRRGSRRRDAITCSARGTRAPMRGRSGPGPGDAPPPPREGRRPPSGRGMIRHSPAPAPRRLPPSALPGPRGGDSGGWGPGEGERDRWGRRRAFEGRPTTAIAGVWDRHMTRSGGPPGSLQGPARGNGLRGERACHGHRAGRGGPSRVTGGRRRPPDDASPRGPGRRPGVLLRHARAGSGRRGEAWMRPPAPRPYGPTGLRALGSGSPPSCVEGVGVTLVCDASG